VRGRLASRAYAVVAFAVAVARRALWDGPVERFTAETSVMGALIAVRRDLFLRGFLEHAGTVDAVSGKRARLAIVAVCGRRARQDACARGAGPLKPTYEARRAVAEV